jgi:hypothetical protein
MANNRVSRMPEDDSHAQGIKPIMECIGYFLLFWGHVETALAAQIDALQKEIDRASLPRTTLFSPLSARLDNWKALAAQNSPDPAAVDEVEVLAMQISELGKFRNIVAHGLVEVRAVPDADPVIVCLSPRPEDSPPSDKPQRI